MNEVDRAFLPALEQARLIRERQASPSELVEMYLARSDRLNPMLGSYFTVTAEKAIAEAKTKTEQLARSDAELPPFFGVPISIKDINLVADVPCSFGIKAARDRVADRDDGVVSKIKAAGFIILGKTATSQLATLPYSEPPGFPPARNPWNLDYTPGGSSGGAAASVAAGLCAIALGSDGGGSVRGPASCCGLVGVKPARGRVTMAPFGDRLAGAAVPGCLARTVTDAAAMLDAISGYFPGDPYWLNAPEPSFLEAARREPGNLRVGYVTELGGFGKTAPECERAVLETVAALESVGHAIEPVELDFQELIEPFTIVWQSTLAEVNRTVPWFVLDRFNRWLLGRAKRAGVGAYMQATTKMQTIARRIVTACSPYDAIALPVYLHPTIRVGEWQKLPARQVLERVIHWVAPCPAFNASGLPTIAIPAGFDRNGVPIGVQLAGQPAGEATLFSLAAQLEIARPWHQHRPEMAKH